jgi:hypothetical protein
VQVRPGKKGFVGSLYYATLANHFDGKKARGDASSMTDAEFKKQRQQEDSQ